MSAIINGRRGAFLQPLTYGVDPSGRYTIYVWRGTVNECLANVPAIEASSGLWEMRESWTRAACELTAHVPTITGQEEQIENTWELFSQDTEKDVLEADIGSLNTMSADNKRLVREKVKDTSGPSPNFTGASASFSTGIYLLMLNGLTHVVTPVPTLRHTQTVSRNYQVPASLTNVGRVMTTAYLQASEDIRSDINANLPNDTSSRVGEGFTLRYGWYKKFPTIRGAARQRTVIVQEWVYGLWPTDPALYGAMLGL